LILKVLLLKKSDCEKLINNYELFYMTREQRIAKDNDRLKNVREDDRRILSNIYEECNFLVKKYSAKYSQQNGLDIEEAYQEAFLVCYQNIKSEKLQVLTVEFKDYISQIMNYKVLDQLYKIDPEKRKQLRNPENKDIVEGEHIIRHVNFTSELADEPSDDDMPIAAGKVNPLATGSYDYDIDRQETIVRQVVKLLTDPCKTIIEMRYYLKLSFDEMLGKVIGFNSVNALRNKRQKCMESLEGELRAKLSISNQ
jgi:RNA polymerase sigma factor (sigma-70 family)